MNCSALDAALKELWPEVYHLSAPKGKTKYIVWAEYGLNDVHGDNRAQIRIPKVQIDAYCQDPNATAEDGFFVSILNTLNDLGISHELQDMSYDPDAAQMRCVILCEVIGGF